MNIYLRDFKIQNVHQKDHNLNRTLSEKEGAKKP